MMQFDLGEYSERKIVHSSGLDGLGSDWKIVAMFQQLEPHYGTTNILVPYSGGGGSLQQVNEVKGMTTVTYFIVVRGSRDEALENLQAQVEAAKKAQALSEAAKADVERKLSLAVADAAQEKGHRERLGVLVDDREALLKRVREQNQKMEADLGKCHSALGSLRMKEILG